MTRIVIKDAMTGRYYRSGPARFPNMGGTKEEALRFDTPLEAAGYMREMPLTILVETEEVES